MSRSEPSAETRGSAIALFILALAQLAASPAAALQILKGTDHAELSTEVSSREVNRIALEGDRIARVVQSAGGFTLEHDPVRGDLYLYPGGPGGPALSGGPAHGGAQAHRGAPAHDRAPADGRAPAPVTLYLGTENGLTYRLTLTPVERASAQVLIRSAAAAGPAEPSPAAYGGSRKNEIAALIGAVARRQPLPGYAVVSAPNLTERQAASREPASNIDEGLHGTRLIETWRGPRFTARVLEVCGGGIRDASELAAGHGSGAVAAWLSGASHGSPVCPAQAAAHGGSVHGGAALAHTRLGVVVESNSSSEAAP